MSSKIDYNKRSQDVFPSIPPNLIFVLGLILFVDRVLTNFLCSNFKTINKRENHFLPTQLSTYCVKQIKEPEDHDTVFIEVNRSIEIITNAANISGPVSQGSIDTKIVNGFVCRNHHPIATLLYTFQMTDPT